MNTNTITIQADQPGHTIDPNIYGQFTEHLGRCIYEGLWVGESSPIANTRGIRKDVVEVLKKLKIPVLRWPGGCFADEYHWKDGIGPRSERPKMINTNWGTVVENNHFGTHEFFDLCEQLGAEPYICGNVGSGTVQEMMEWVEYMTSDAESPMANLRRKHGREKPWALKYFGVGNENWGCGGHMRPDYYADLYRRYNTYVKNYPGSEIYRIAGGANIDDYDWTEVLMREAGKKMNGLSLHYYTFSGGDFSCKGAATGFPDEQWHSALWQTLRIDELITKHSAIMDKYDPEKKVGLVVDEWGIWSDVENGTNPGFLHQQNSIRDAVVAALNLHIFHKHGQRVTMANIAQMVNVLQAMVLTDHERILLTPTYHVFEMFRVHMGAKFVPLEIKTGLYEQEGRTVPQFDASASLAKDGTLSVSLVNLHPGESAKATVKVAGKTITRIYERLLTAQEMDSHNTFEHPDMVKPCLSQGASLHEGVITVELPPKSVQVLTLT